jgi:pilus assembly protein CpaB
MMRQRALLMLLLACLMGGAAVYLASDWLNRQIPAPVAVMQPKVERTETTVVVARLPLRFGDELTGENLRVINWPADTVPDGAFASVKDLLSGERRVALRDISPNEVVLKSRVSGFGGRATLSALLDPSMRAVTVRVNDVQGVAGFVLPGDRVDVVFTRPENAADGSRTSAPPVTDILLQNVKVLAVDQLADNMKDQPVIAKAVTLEASTDDAQKLVLASQVGTLSLALRNFGNTAIARARTVTVEELISRQPAVVAAKAAPRAVGVSHSMRIVRGTQESVHPVLPEGSRIVSAQSAPLKRAPGVELAATAQ